MTCPNLSHPTYQSIKEQYGEHAQYVFASLIDSPTFQKWKGDDEIPGLDVNGNVLSNLGSTFSVSGYFNQVLTSAAKEYNIKDYKEFNLNHKGSEFYEALPNGSLVFRKSVVSITSEDKIIFGHPTIGKTFLKTSEKYKDTFISLDDDYAQDIKDFIADNKKSTEDKYQYQERKPQEFIDFTLRLFDQAKALAKKTGKMLFTSNNIVLDERADDFDKVIDLDKDEFFRRIGERNTTYDVPAWKNQIDKLISKVDSNKIVKTSGYLSDLLPNENIKYQKPWNANHASDEFVRGVVAKLQKQFGIKAQIINDIHQKWAGKFENGVPTINMAYATEDTAFHEFAHPFVETIKKTNPALFDKLTDEIIREGSILRRTKSLYPELVGIDLVSEAIVQAIGEYAAGDLKSPTLLSLIKELLEMISNHLGDLFHAKYLLPAELPADMTLRHLGALMNTAFHIPVMTLEGLHQQKIDNFTELMGKANVDQQKTIQVLAQNSDKVTLEEVSHTYEDQNGISYMPTTTAIGSTFTGDGNKYAIHSVWGNQAHGLLQDAIKGSDYRETPNLSSIARSGFIKKFEELVKELTKDGSVLVSEAVLSDVTAKIAGSADLIVVHPDGSISIYDLKTSMSATEGPYSKYDRVYKNELTKLERSKRGQHTFQLGMYKALAEHMKLRVADLKVIPMKLDTLGEHVNSVKEESLIPVQSPESKIQDILTAYRKVSNEGSKSQKDYSKFLQKLQVLLQEKISKLNDSLTKKSGASAKRLAELQGLQKLLSGTDALGEISKVIDAIHTELVVGKNDKKSYSERFDLLVKGTTVALANGDSNQIKQMIKEFNHYFNYVNDYDQLDEFQDIYADSVKGKVSAEPDSPLAKLRDIITAREAMQAAYYQAVRPLYAAILADGIDDNANKAAQAFLDSKEKYNRLAQEASATGHPERAKHYNKLYEQAKADFKKMYSNKADLVDQLTTTSGDLGMFEYLTGTLSGSTDNILGLFGKKIKSVFARIDELMFKFQHAAAQEFKIFAKASGRNPNDVEAFNQGLYEEVYVYHKNAEGEYIATKEKHFVSPLDTNRYNKALNDMHINAELKYNQVLEEKGEEEATKARGLYIRQWYRDNHKPRPQAEIDQLIQEKKEELRLNYISMEDYQKWTQTNMPEFEGSVEYLRDLSEPRPELYASESYKAIQKDPALKRYYDFLITTYQKSQEQYPISKRLGYRLPAIHKKFEDKIREAGGWKKVLPNLKELVTSTDQDVNRYGFGKKIVPVYFTQRMDADDVSNDLLGSITRFAQAANTYEAIAGSTDHVGLETEATALVNILKERNVERTDSKGLVMMKQAAKKLGLTDAEIDKKGGLYAAFLEHFVNQNLYGESEAKVLVTIPEFRIPGTDKSIGGGVIDVGKTTNTFMGLASWPALGGPFNILKAVANWFNAKANVFVEAYSQQYLNKKDLAQGVATYAKWVASDMLKDYNSPVPQSLEGQLMEWYSPIQGSFRDKVGQDLTWDGYKKSLVPGSWFFLQQAGEHSAQSEMFFGILNATKVLDRNTGNMISLLKAYTKDENGMLVLKEGVEWTNEQKDALTNRIHAINKGLHGIYNKMDKSVAQKQAIGRLAFMYRKFLVPAVKRRWGSIRVDQELGDTVEGFHKTLWKTLRNDHQELIAHYMGRENSLTPMEQANIRRATIELALIATLTTLISVMVGMKDDDDQLKKTDTVKGYMFNAVLYEAMRINSEFKFFIPGLGMGDQLRIFTSPSAANSTLQKLYQFGHQMLTGPLEEYDKNSKWHKKGESKLGAAAKSLLGMNGGDPNRALEQFNKLY